MFMVKEICHLSQGPHAWLVPCTEQCHVYSSKVLWSFLMRRSITMSMLCSQAWAQYAMSGVAL